MAIHKREEFTIHHMSYVRRNIRKKLENSMTGKFYNIDKFVEDFNKYMLGEKLFVAPDFLTRRTVLCEDIFDIGEP